MALSPPNASSAGLRARPSCEEGHNSLHTHPCDCDGLHPLDSPECLSQDDLRHGDHLTECYPTAKLRLH
jgi:hypothetical protein